MINPMIQIRTFVAVAWFAATVPAWGQFPVPVAPVAPIAPVAPVPSLAPMAPFRPIAPDFAYAEQSVLLAQNAFYQVPSPAKGGNDDGLYQNGQNALENRRWDQALQNFSQVASRGGPRADGATYWKAYTLNKLSRREEALAAIADLRKTYAGSRWLEDAGVLELEMKQAAGQTVTPENQSDEELKLLALNGLMQSDPQRALPLIENLLKSTQSPKLKKNAVYVLAQNGSPRARQILEQIARGGTNPDLQTTAIRYLGERGESGPLLWEIYGSSADVSVKRQILNSFSSRNDKDHLTQIARAEKDSSLRLAAIRQLGSASFGAELMQLYQAETSVDVKRQILSTLAASGGPDRLMEILRTEKDVNLRRSAIQQLAATGGASTEALLQLYSSEQDERGKQSVLDALAGQNNAKALVALARAEKDPQMKRRIVQRLSGLSSPEATDYMLELLK
jgi:hypothetical protein